MMNFKNWKLATKISTLMIAVGILSITVLGIAGFINVYNTLEYSEFEKLTAIREIKAGQIQNEFQLIEKQLQTLADTPYVGKALVSFNQSFNELKTEKANPTYTRRVRSFFKNDFLPKFNQARDKPESLENIIHSDTHRILLQDQYIAGNTNEPGSKHLLNRGTANIAYNDAHAKYHPQLRSFLTQYEFYDIFLINLKGDIIYSVYKEADFATNLRKGLNKTSALKQVFSTALILKKGEATLEDFQPYWASYNAAASFIATPIYDGNEKIGVLAFQMPVERINRIMTNNQKWESTGLGKSGETYLVGGDLKLRSQSRFFLENKASYLALLKNSGIPQNILNKIDKLDTSIGLQPVDSISAKESTNNKKGTKLIEDYRGVKVLSSYTPVQLQGFTWGLIAEVDYDEAFASFHDLQITVLIILAVLIVVIFIAARYFSRKIAAPLEMLSSTMTEIESSGHLALRVEYESTDEIGNSIASFHKLLESWQRILKGVQQSSYRLLSTTEEVAGNSMQMASSSEQLKGNSSQIAAASEEISINMKSVAESSTDTSDNIVNVTAAVQELSANIDSISAAAEQASTNMSGVASNVESINHETSTVANAMEEMNSTMADIHEKTNHAMSISGEANNSALANLEIMNHLGDSANRIGKVVKLISNIASQTNMLALNATIEATNAGAAGKGFAVVADEVKELAQQSAEANSEIAEQINKIQTQVNDALRHTESVNKIVGEVSEINSLINNTVTEQTNTAKEITRSIDSIVKASVGSSTNVKEAGQGMQEIARSVAEASLASKESSSSLAVSTKQVKSIARSSQEAAAGVDEVNKNIQVSQSSIGQISGEIASVQRSSEQLSALSSELNELIAVFKIE